MELDELRQAWQTLDRRLARQNTINLQLLKDSRLEKASSSLRPLFWGQVAQMAFGVPFVLLAVSVWPQHLDVPHLLAAGIIVHVYGVATIVMAGVTLALSRIDHAAPILVIQKQLARLRRFYVINGLVTGLSWWLIWIPALMLLAGLAGVDLYARAPSVIWIGLAIGIPGLLATWWFHRWSRQPSRPRLARFMEDNMTSESLRKAQACIDEIVRFERE